MTEAERLALAAQRKQKDRVKKFKKIKYVYDGKESEGSVQDEPSRLSDLVVDYEKQAWKIQPTVTGTTSVWGSAGWGQLQHPQSNRPRVNLEPSKGYANPQDASTSASSSTTTANNSSSNSASIGQGFLNTTTWGSGGHTSLASLASMQAGLHDPHHPHYQATSPRNNPPNNNSGNSNRNSDSRQPHQMSPQHGTSGFISQSQSQEGQGNRGSQSAARPQQNKGFQTQSDREQARNSGFK
jgi:hypothetical protein